MNLQGMSFAELKSLEERVARGKLAKKAAAKAAKNGNAGRPVKAVSDNIAKRMKIGGAKVIDGLKPLKIRITAEDVRKGAQKNATSCAAARALCREGFTEARVHAARTYVKQPDGTWLRYVTRPALRSEIVAFDRGGNFEPGEYHLSPIQPAEQIGNRAKRKGYNYRKTMAQRNAAPKRKNHVTTGVRSRFLPS